MGADSEAHEGRRVRGDLEVAQRPYCTPATRSDDRCGSHKNSMSHGNNLGVISPDLSWCRKAVGEVRHPLMLKTLQPGLERNFFSLVKFTDPVPQRASV